MTQTRYFLVTSTGNPFYLIIKYDDKNLSFIVPGTKEFTLFKLKQDYGYLQNYSVRYYKKNRTLSFLNPIETISVHFKRFNINMYTLEIIPSSYQGMTLSGHLMDTCPTAENLYKVSISTFYPQTVQEKEYFYGFRNEMDDDHPPITLIKLGQYALYYVNNELEIIVHPVVYSTDMDMDMDIDG